MGEDSRKMEEILKKIKDAVLKVAEKHGIEIDKIILFGSRARGDYTEESDWDILIVTGENLDKNEKYDFIHEVHRKIVLNIDVAADIIVVSRKHQEKFKDVYGSVVGMATLEGNTI